MALSIKHGFTSAKGNGTDATQVQPAHWNAEHVVTAGAKTVLGNFSTVAGAPVTDLVVSDQGIRLMQANAFAGTAIGLVAPGTVCMYFNSNAPEGWIPWVVGTIGRAGSGATIRANADCYPLYYAIWNGWSVYPENLPLSNPAGPRGASAQADFDAGRTLALPVSQGRSPMNSHNNGTGITNRPVGTFGGSERVSLLANELPPHSHSGTTDAMNQNKTHHHDYTAVVAGGASFPGGGQFTLANVSTSDTNIDHAHTFTTNGGNGLVADSHLNMMPWFGIYFIIKL